MQGHDWNDMRHVLALHRAGTLAGAGRALGVNETTVARRIRAVERALGTPLFRRGDGGTQSATGAGERVLALAETAERAHLSVPEAAGRAAAAVQGVVRVSSVPVLVNRVLLPGLPRLLAAHPGLVVELVPEARNMDLTKREADLAVRFSRPRTGGLGTRARRLGALGFAVFGPAGARRSDLPWIGYDAAHAALPQARWLERAIARSGGRSAGLRVSDLETAREAVAAGLGRTLLPIFVGAADARLVRLEPPETPPPQARDVWLLSPAEPDERASVVAVKDWIAGLPWGAA